MWLVIRPSAWATPQTDLGAQGPPGGAPSEPESRASPCLHPGGNHTLAYIRFSVLQERCTKTRTKLRSRMISQDFCKAIRPALAFMGCIAFTGKSRIFSLRVSLILLQAQTFLCFGELIIKSPPLWLGCMIAWAQALRFMLSPIYCTFNYLWSYHTGDIEMK